jgi:outer membrane protein
MRACALICFQLLLLGAALAQAPRLTLDQAEETALKHNPQISAAVFNALFAEQVTRETRSGLYPNVFGAVTGVGGDDNSKIGVGALNAGTIYNRFGTGVSASQLLWDFGRTNNLVESSKLHATAQVQNTQFMRAVVRLQVDRAYFAALRAEAVLRVAEQTVAARQLVADQVTALAHSNLKSTLDVSFAQVNVSEAKLLLAQAQNDLRSAFAELATAMGTPAAAEQSWDLAEATLATKPETDSALLIQQALKNRPDVNGLRLESDAAKKQIAAEHGLFLPSVSAIASMGVLPGHSDNLPGHYTGAGLNINVPVFNGHAFSARRAEAEYHASAVDQNVRDIENRVSRDVTLAWLATQTAYQRVGLTAELLQQATLALELAQTRYDLGLSSIVELSQAQLAKTNADIQNAAAKYDFQLQTAVLRYQTGQ